MEEEIEEDLESGSVTNSQNSDFGSVADSQKSDSGSVAESQKSEVDIEQDPLLTPEIQWMLHYPVPNSVTNEIPARPRAGKTSY